MDTLTLALALSYVKKQIEEAKKEGFRVQIEQDRSILETTGEEKIFYFLPKTSDNPTDGYDEFVYTNNNWEQVGVTDVDLSSYATKAEVGNLNNLPTTDKSSIVSAISETFTSVSNGKSLVASAITDKGVSTSSDATFETMAQNIEAIPTGATLISKTITENGVYNATDDNADGYDVVTVSVPEKNTLDDYIADTLEVANIPSAVSLGGGFFYGRKFLTDVIMPNVKSIGNTAFFSCQNLALTSLPNGVTSIGLLSFARCTGIPYLDFSNFDHIPTIQDNSFNDTTFPFYFRDQQQLDEWAAATNWSTYANRFQIKPSGVM